MKTIVKTRKFQYVKNNVFKLTICKNKRVLHSIMRRTYERGTKERLSFFGGPHAPVNRADNMENDGSSTVSGHKEAMEVPKNFKGLRKLGARNTAQYSAVNVLFPAFFSYLYSLLPYYPPCLQERVARLRS